MAYEKHSVWSEAARTPKLFVFDWRLLILVFLVIIAPGNKYSWIFMFLGLVVSYYLNFIGYTIPNAMRRFGVLLGGKKAHGKPYWFRRKYD